MTIYFFPIFEAIGRSEDGNKSDFLVAVNDGNIQKGPYKKEEIIRLCGEIKGIHQPHLIRTHYFTPDSDYQQETGCAAWCVICGSNPDEKYAPIWFGKGNKFQSPFIACRVIHSELYPWSSLFAIQKFMEVFSGRQAYWEKQKVGLDMKMSHVTMQELINKFK